MSDLELEISGMTCESCARHVDSALRDAGAHEVSVDWRRGKALARGELDQRMLERELGDTRYRVERIQERRARPASDGDTGRDYDLVVLGSGSAAFAAAIRARDLGRSALLVEQGAVGGTCVNVGCVPSKSLLVDSERHRIGAAGRLADAVARKQALVGRLRQEKYVELLGEYEIALREGRAELIDGNTVTVDGEPVTAEAILVATGAEPAVPPIPGLAEAGYLTSTSALEVTDPPRRLVVLGAGAVGLELGQMLAGFGSEVTFVDLVRIAPFEEPEVSQAMREILEGDGHRVVEGAETREVTVDAGGKVLRGVAHGEPFELHADEVLVATSRTPRTAGLGLERVGVALDARGAVVVDSEQRTSVPSVYAAGDATSQPQFVYVAAAGGGTAAENAFGSGGERLDFDSLPRIIFTSPQIAAAGLTESQAAERGVEVETRVLPLSAVPRALVNGDTRGLYKLVAERGTGRLLGVSAVADGAAEAIQAAVLAIRNEMTVQEVASAWAPYLTMAEGLKLAAQTFSRDVAKLSCCAA